MQLLTGHVIYIPTQNYIKNLPFDLAQRALSEYIQLFKKNSTKTYA